jgi:hypothetical protein
MLSSYSPSKAQKIRFACLLVISIFALVLAACGGSSKASTSRNLKMASIDEMPAEVKAAAQVVRESYQFAAANPDVMTHIPCYCGCGAMGHTSNYACYVSGQGPDGKLEYDTHALGCSICVDITQDTMRLFGEGKSVEEIRAYVDSTYSKYGPSNIP